MIESILYVVATPIGNMADITTRAVDTLREVDIIYAEDTRQSAKLLQYFNIKNTLYPLHKHNEIGECENMLRHLQAGKNVAIVSDAGTPLIADPGYPVIAYLRAQGVRIEVIPGCCSVVAALSISGLAGDTFKFAGFIPAKQSQRLDFLSQYDTASETTVFFETPHRIVRSLLDFQTIFLPDRKIFIARELTKRFEDTALLTIATAQEWIAGDENRTRGEFVLVLEKSEDGPEYDWQSLAKVMLSHNIHTKTITKILAEQTGLAKKEIYRYVLDINS